MDFKDRSALSRSSPNAPEIAMVYVGLYEKDQAMAWLETPYTERFSPRVLMRPCFDPPRSDPRFEDLVRRIGRPHWTEEFDDGREGSNTTNLSADAEHP